MPCAAARSARSPRPSSRSEVATGVTCDHVSGEEIVMRQRRKVLNTLLAAMLLSPIVSSAGAESSVFEGPVARPEACAPGDRPETGIQGEVPIADRQSG